MTTSRPRQCRYCGTPATARTPLVNGVHDNGSCARGLATRAILDRAR